jgi:hypothetical protein
MGSRFSIVAPAALLCLLSGIGARDAAAQDSLPCDADSSRYEGFAIRQARVGSPFSFPGGVLFQSGLVQPPGAEFRNAATGEIAKKLRDELTAAPLPEPPFSITAVVAFLENCDDTSRQVDVVYYLFATRLLLPQSWTWESSKARSEDPRTASGVVSSGPRLTLTPALRFDSTDRLVGGGRLVFGAPQGRIRLTADAAGSKTFTNAAAEVSGRHVPEKAGLWQLAYGAGYRFRRERADGQDLRQGFGYGWLSGATRPLPGLNGALRYGFQVESGIKKFAPDTPGLSTDARYTAVKLVGGLSGGKGTHDYAAQAGVQLGLAGDLTPAYRKWLLDAVYGWRISPRRPLFDHRALDLEWHLAAGLLTPDNGGAALQNDRFFGGTREKAFTEMADWHFPATPVVRSFPANRFAAPRSTSNGLGRGEKFVSMNFTAAMTTWRLPLLPKEVREAKDFNDQIEAGKGTAQAALESYHESKDPAFDAAIPVGTTVEATLEALNKKLGSLTAPATLQEALEACQENAERLADRMPSVMKGRVFAAVLNASVSGTLPSVAKTCGDELNAVLTGAPLTTELATLKAAQAQLDDIVRNRVNHALVEKRAKDDSALAVRALDAFSKEINLVSLDPVFIYDVGYVEGPAGHMTRHAVGAGVRLTLASHVSFTAGYAVNGNRVGGEPRGAVFVNIRFIDLIR